MSQKLSVIYFKWVENISKFNASYKAKMLTMIKDIFLK